MGREKARREREREGLGVHTGTLKLLQAPNKNGLPLFPTYFPLFTANFKDSPSLVLHTGDRPQRHL